MTRVAVSGLGVVNVAAGFAELVPALTLREGPPRPEQPTESQP